MACRYEVLHYSAQKLPASLMEVWADNKTIKARFEDFLVIGNINKLSEGVHDSESDEKTEQTHYALHRSLTKAIHQMSWELNVPYTIVHRVLCKHLHLCAYKACIFPDLKKRYQITMTELCY